MSLKRKQTSGDSLEILQVNSFIDDAHEEAQKIFEEYMILKRKIAAVWCAIKNFESRGNRVERGTSVGERLDLVDGEVDDFLCQIDVESHAPTLHAYVDEFFKEYKASFVELYKRYDIDWCPQRQIQYALLMVQCNETIEELIDYFGHEVSKISLLDDNSVNVLGALTAVIRAAEELWQKQKTK